MQMLLAILLLLLAANDGHEFTFVTVHMITNPGDRMRQARTLREWVEDHLGENLIVLKEFNVGLRFSETKPSSDIGRIRGLNTTDTDDDLFDVHAQLDSADRDTHVSGRELDRILLAPSLVDEAGLDFESVSVRRDLAIRGAEDQGGGVNYALPEDEQDLSDHFPVLLTLAAD